MSLILTAMSRITKNDEIKFAEAYVLQGDHNKSAAYRSIRPDVTIHAATMGGKRMLERPRVQELIEACEGRVVEVMPATHEDREKHALVQHVEITQLDVINLFVHAAVIDPGCYYHDDGTCKRLNELTLDQRRNIRHIKWGVPDKVNGVKRIPIGYTLCDQDKNKQELAKIMGLSGPQFDFAGFLALITGKPKDEAEEDIKRLNHADGCQFDKIRTKVIEGECTESGESAK